MSRNPINARRVLAALAAVMLAAGSVVASDDMTLDEVRAVISDKFEMIQPQDVKQSPIDGWYMIQKGSVIAYVTADGRYLLQGDLIDLDSQVNLSELSRNDARHDLVAAFGEENAISFAPDDVKYKVTVFTDVDCTYCRKLHAEIDDYMDRGIAVRYVLYPRNGPASRAWSTSEDVVCASDRGVALTKAKLGQKFESAKCNTAMLTRHYSLGQDIGLSGTPAIVLEDGTLIGGYVSAEMLNMRIAAAAMQQ